MARISGIDLPINKRIEIALTYIHGIGLTTAKKILNQSKVSVDKKVSELNDKEVKLISDIISQNYRVEGELKQEVVANIRRLKDIRCYRGLRHRSGLPVRGQNTRSNAVTRKGKNLAVGGLRLKITNT